MDGILEHINGLSPFVQGLLGSAVFAISSILLQRVMNRAKKSGSEIFRVFARLDMVRHILHKDYVNSRDLQRSSYGSAVAMLFAFRWMLGGFLIAIFFIGVHSIINGNWLFVAASWFCFNCFLEAHNWVKDTGHEKHISHVPDEVQADVITVMYPPDPAPRIEKE